MRHVDGEFPLSGNLARTLKAHLDDPRRHSPSSKHEAAGASPSVLSAPCDDDGAIRLSVSAVATVVRRCRCSPDRCPDESSASRTGDGACCVPANQLARHGACSGAYQSAAQTALVLFGGAPTGNRGHSRKREREYRRSGHGISPFVRAANLRKTGLEIRRFRAGLQSVRPATADIGQ